MNNSTNQQTRDWGQDWNSSSQRMGPTDWFQTNEELQLPLVVPNMKSGKGFQTNGELQTKPSAIPNMESGIELKSGS